jgi:hypothetical protein
LLALGGSDNGSIWDDALDALIVGIDQVRFSGWKPDECIAIGNELRSWKHKGISETEGVFSPAIDVNIMNSQSLAVQCYLCSHCSEVYPASFLSFV